MTTPRSPVASVASAIALHAAARAPCALADENLWVYTRGADTMSAGALELEQVDIWRSDKDSCDYDFHDLRLELEYGPSSRLTLSAEVLLFDHNYAVDDPDLQPTFDSHGG